MLALLRERWDEEGEGWGWGGVVYRRFVSIARGALEQV